MFLKLSAALILSLTIGCTPALGAPAPEIIKIGVSTALTGEAATFGTDLKNALLFADQEFGGRRYELIFEDDQCSGRTAVTVANKLIRADGVRYVLGFACNAALLPAAAIYQRAGVLVISSCATTGDVTDPGDHIFRLFPADHQAALRLQRYIAEHHRAAGILTEQNEYPALMERAFIRQNRRSARPLTLTPLQVPADTAEFKPILLKFKSEGIDALYVNTNAEAGFIRVVKQLDQIGFHPQVYTAYFPSAPTVLAELGSRAEGIKYANLPATAELLSPEGQSLMAKYQERYGDPISGFPVVPLTVEAFRVLDLALRSGEPPHQYLRNRQFQGVMLNQFRFNRSGELEGVEFQMQTIQRGKAVVLER